jgi:hypothetical protein
MSAHDKGPELLRENAGVLKSRMGTFYPGSHVIFRGHDLHEDLKDMDWLELYVFGITGRRFTKEQLRLMHAMWTCTSYPDVRLWNNRVAALAGSSRSSGTLGLAAALAVSEASIYGGGILARTVDFFVRTQRRMENGEDLAACLNEELAERRIIGGYGRPIINADERIRHLLALARDLGLDQGPHLRLAFAVEEQLLASGRWRLKMNYAALIAALGADIGLTTREFSLLMFPMFLAGMPPGYIEASDRPEGTLYPIPCSDILYEGEPSRTWHRQEKSSN